MFLTPYFKKEDNIVTIEPQQASDFAKQIAGDFNPIHDVTAKRFCVPGDLLFSLVLTEYGLSQQMSFNFSGMVGAGVELLFPPKNELDNLAQFDIKDDKDKTYLSVSRAGASQLNQTQIESFIRSYVAFSGLNFIHVLVPMMIENEVMINPARPLVIYESMSVNLHSFDFESVELSLVEQALVVEGKRGDVTLKFELHSGDKLVGTGEKTLVMSGLRPYEKIAMDEMVNRYESSRYS